MSVDDHAIKQSIPADTQHGVNESVLSGAKPPKSSPLSNDFFSPPLLNSASSLPKAPSIVAPKGGGSISGMGEKFNVSPSTGSGSLSIPIRISPARSGLQPQLSLAYDSATGNGEFGLGWKLTGTGSISRKTSKGLPLYNDRGSDVDSDVFLLAGAEDLVPLFKVSASGEVLHDSNGVPILDESVYDGFLVRKYSPRIVQSFVRTERWTNLENPDDVHWRVLTPENHTLVFGRDENSRIFDPSSTTGHQLRIFTWMQSEVYDAHGNAIMFTYKSEDSSNVPTQLASESHRSVTSRSANRYLKTINYGNTIPNRSLATWDAFSASQLPANSWLFTVVMDYGEHDVVLPTLEEKLPWPSRSDPFSSYRAGFEIRNYRLCQRILMFHHFSELDHNPFLVSSLALTYHQDPSLTLLRSACQNGYMYDGVSKSITSKSLPPLELSYQEFPSDNDLPNSTAEAIDRESIGNLPIGLDGNTFKWIDLDGEGLSGVLAADSGAWYYKRNTSANNLRQSDTSSDPSSNRAYPRFSDQETLKSTPSTSVGNRSHFGDLSGAGKLDLIETTPNAWGFFTRDLESTTGWTSFQSLRQFPSLDFANQNTKLVDLTGDGLPDILICEDRVFTWYRSEGEYGYACGSTVTQYVSEDDGPVCFFQDSTQTLYLADMSGDGVVDIVRVRNADVCYWPNLGYGRFGSLIRMDNAPLFDRQDTFADARIRLVDIDGSGTTDLLYISEGGVDLYKNYSGNSFSPGIRLQSPFPNDKSCVISTVDLLGNGTGCIVWSSSLPCFAEAPMRYMDLNKGKKPYLLSQITNNLGVDILLQYAPSTKFFLDDKQAGNPWITSLPFPVHCVEKVQTIDNISRNVFVKKYSYHDGYFDGVEREFRGFARTDQWDTDSFAAMSTTPSANVDSAWHVSPVRTTTWFHTGVYFGNDIWSQQLATEYYGANDGGFTTPRSQLLGGTLLPDSVLPTATIESDALRECCRSLKGHMLRKEVYGEDGSEGSNIPYSIEESNYTVEVLQGTQDAHQHSVYFVSPRESIKAGVEKDPTDPRIEHDMILDVDAYGNVRKNIRVVYGRAAGKSKLSGNDRLTQETTEILYIENDITDLLDEQHNYRTPIAFESRSYELTGIKPPAGAFRFAFQDFAGSEGDFAPLAKFNEIPFEAQKDGISLQKRLLKQSRVIFRKDDLSGLLPRGKIESLAVPGESYTLCFTPGLLSSVYQRKAIHKPIETLLPNPETILLGSMGETQFGYVDLDANGSFWSRPGNVRFSTKANVSPQLELIQARSTFFQPVKFIDPFGNTTIVSYDAYSMFPVKVENGVGNTTLAEMDYRVLHPRLVTGPNGNRIAVAFDSLGMVSGLAKMGKPASGPADNLDGFKSDLSDVDLDELLSQPRSSAAFALLGSATNRIAYDYLRYMRSKGPAVAVTLARVQHVGEITDQGEQSQVDFSYYDGTGQLIQRKMQAKSGPLVDQGPSVDNRWICSGWRILNNKGNPVRQYEPFFDDTPDFKFDLRIGHSSIVLYDTLSRNVATLRQDKTFTKTVLTAWSVTIFDQNDNIKVSNPKDDSDIGHLIQDLPTSEYLPSWYDARISGKKGPFEKAAAEKAAAHANTPLILHTDPLGRFILQLNDAGAGPDIATKIRFDINGQVRELSDALNRSVQMSEFNMKGDLIHQKSMEAGETWTLRDVSGEIGLIWNSRNNRFRYVYDSARRQTETWVIEGSEEEVMVQQQIFGEAAPDAELHNLRAALFRSRDQAGEVIYNDYDFNGNILSSDRRLAKTYKTTLSWSSVADLEDSVYSHSTTFDALSRPVLAEYPDGSKVRRIYDDSGHVQKVFVNIFNEQASSPTDWTPVIIGVDHNANDQIVTTAYGNGTTTTRVYDPLLYRLQKMTTVGPAKSRRLQDLSYTFDPVGNITHIQDDAQQTIFFRNNRVDPSSDFTYDAMYRLVQASGREHLGQTNGRPDSPIVPGPFDSAPSDDATNGNALGTYAETYQYDMVGNILSVSHVVNDPSYPGWKRSYSYNEPSQLDSGQTSNRLSQTSVGSLTDRYSYDEHGNITSMSQMRLMHWDFNEQLQATSTQVVNSGTPETTYYVYDGQGDRIRKVTEGQSGGSTGIASPTPTKERLYLGGVEVSRTYKPGEATPTLERVSLFVDYDSSKVCQIDTRTVGTDSGATRTLRFSLGNQLDSVNLLLDEQAKLNSYEEYFPYGGTAFHSTNSQNEVPKRYRFSGKEKDDESGLYYFGARYYAPWLGRWISPDPGGTTDGFNLYQFAQSSPIVYRDRDGRAAILAWGIGLAEVGEGLAALGTGAAAIVSSPVVIGAVLVVGVGVIAYEGYKTYKEYDDFKHPTVVGPTIAPNAEPKIDPQAPPTVDPVPKVEPKVEPKTEPHAVPKVEPNAKPKKEEKEKEKEKDKDKEKDKEKEKEKDKPKRKYDPLDPRQHHIYPREFNVFFSALGIDIDAAHNVVWVSDKFHIMIHAGYNLAWKALLDQFIDWDALEASGGKTVSFKDPITGKPISTLQASLEIQAIGQLTKAGLLETGIALPSSVPYLREWGKNTPGYNTLPRDRYAFWEKPRTQWP